MNLLHSRRDREHGSHPLMQLAIFNLLDHLPHNESRSQSAGKQTEQRHFPALVSDSAESISHAPLTIKTESFPTDMQNQSLLSNLPPEVLVQIYLCILGADVIRVLNTSNRSVQKRDGSAARDLLHLLQSCKRSYIEGINILYSINPFEFDSQRTFVDFSSAIAPDNLDAIRCLNFKFDFNGTIDQPRWERLWRIVASMIAVEQMRMSITSCKDRLTATAEDRLLEPLGCVQGLRVFEISLPWVREGPKEKEGNAYRIIRTRSQ